MSDKQISCKQCGEKFTFTAGEQEWFAARDLQEPKYCESCRKERKKAREERNRNFETKTSCEENSQKAA